MNSRVRVLYVDDSPGDRALFRRMMFEVDPQAEHAKAWWKNVELIESSVPLGSYEEYNTYDGVILDYHLSGPMTGYEIAQQLHIRFPFLPIMLMTGAAADNTLPPDAREWVDQITYKYGAIGARAVDDPYAVSRAFIRYVSGLKAAIQGDLDANGVPLPKD